ncbi:MAG: hypothetical protein CFE21_04170 [Bacteroidetes bacterium B1(2017)]|nr:MAG: hypothetical protein CFE21_04170 [Bacteroidetes bacterium B1(2017)]
MKRTLLILGLIFYSFFSMAIKPSANAPKLSFGFVKNAGQWLNQKGEVSSSVMYLFQSGNLNIQLRENGFSYELVQNLRENSLEIPMEPQQIIKSSANIHRIDIDFVGASNAITKEELEQGEGQLIFHDKKDFNTAYTLNHYKKVLYKNVYPNIDIEFLIRTQKQQNTFKYNIILHPGAKVDDIKFKINGTEQSTITPNGDLVIATSLGDLKENIPLSYELNERGKEGKSIKAKYVQLASNLIGFSIGKRDLTKTLVIDPVAWCTYFGGDGYEFPSGIAYDNSGNIFVTGRTNSTTGLATAGAYQTTLGGGTNNDTYIAKFTGGGTLLWATYLGGTEQDNVNDLAIDKFGNVIICGSTGSTTGISTATAFQPALSGSIDGFISKFSTTGSAIWSTYLGFTSADDLMGIAIDLNADVYVTGYTSSTTALMPGVYQMNNAGASDAFLAKISSAGSLLYATYYGGIGSDYATDIYVDKDKNIYFAGYANSTAGITTAGSYQPNRSGNIDGVFAKFNSSWQLVYGSYYGGTSNDYFVEMDVDADGNLIFVGYTNSATGIYITGGYQNTFGGGTWDGLVLKTDTSGVPKWASYVGGSSNDFTYSAVSDASSNIYICGGSASTDKIATAGANQATNAGGSYDGYIIKLDKTGTNLSGTYFGAIGSDFVRECTISTSGDLLFAGETTSPSGITTAGTHQTTMKGVSDIFICKLSNSAPGSIGNNIVSPNQGLCLGNAAQTLTGTTPTGGDGMFNYQWLSSPSGLAGSFVPASGTNANDTYIPGSLTVNTYYKRVVFSGTQTDTSNMISVIVSTNFSAGFTVNKTIQCLKNNQFIFTDTTTTGAGALSYWWDFGNGKTSTNQTDTVSYTASVDNLFKVRLVTSLNGGCADTSYTQVILINNPLAKTITGKDTVMKGTTEPYIVSSTNGSSYAWYYTNGTGRSTTNSINIKWTLQGDVQLALLETNGGGCKGDTSYKNIYVKLPTSEEELFGSDLTIYPNPSQGKVFIESSSNEPLSIAVLDITGTQIYKASNIANTEIDLSNAPAGMYIICLTNVDGNTLHKKIQLSR